MKIKYTVEVEVTDQVLLDTVIDMAGYGIGYWAQRMHPDWDARNVTVTWWDEGRLASDSDYDEPERLKVDFDTIAKAIGRIAGGEPIEYLADSTRAAVGSFLVELQSGEEFPGGDIDADAADEILQVALFGKVVFG